MKDMTADPVRRGTGSLIAPDAAPAAAPSPPAAAPPPPAAAPPPPTDDASAVRATIEDTPMDPASVELQTPPVTPPVAPSAPPAPVPGATVHSIVPNAVTFNVVPEQPMAPAAPVAAESPPVAVRPEPATRHGATNEVAPPAPGTPPAGGAPLLADGFTGRTLEWRLSEGPLTGPPRPIGSLLMPSLQLDASLRARSLVEGLGQIGAGSFIASRLTFNLDGITETLLAENRQLMASFGDSLALFRQREAPSGTPSAAEPTPAGATSAQMAGYQRHIEGLLGATQFLTGINDDCRAKHGALRDALAELRRNPSIETEDALQTALDDYTTTISQNWSALMGNPAGQRGMRANFVIAFGQQMITDDHHPHLQRLLEAMGVGSIREMQQRLRLADDGVFGPETLMKATLYLISQAAQSIEDTHTQERQAAGIATLVNGLKDPNSSLSAIASSGACQETFAEILSAQHLAVRNEAIVDTRTGQPISVEQQFALKQAMLPHAQEVVGRKLAAATVELARVGGSAPPEAMARAHRNLKDAEVAAGIEGGVAPTGPGMAAVGPETASSAPAVPLTDPDGRVLPPGASQKATQYREPERARAWILGAREGGTPEARARYQRMAREFAAGVPDAAMTAEQEQALARARRFGLTVRQEGGRTYIDFPPGVLEEAIRDHADIDNPPPELAAFYSGFRDLLADLAFAVDLQDSLAALAMQMDRRSTSQDLRALTREFGELELAYDQLAADLRAQRELNAWMRLDPRAAHAPIALPAEPEVAPPPATIVARRDDGHPAAEARVEAAEERNETLRTADVRARTEYQQDLQQGALDDLHERRDARQVVATFTVTDANGHRVSVEQSGSGMEVATVPGTAEA